MHIVILLENSATDSMKLLNHLLKHCIILPDVKQNAGWSVFNCWNLAQEFLRMSGEQNSLSPPPAILNPAQKQKACMDVLNCNYQYKIRKDVLEKRALLASCQQQFWHVEFTLAAKTLGKKNFVWNFLSEWRAVWRWLLWGTVW